MHSILSLAENTYQLSIHARTRIRQRGIPKAAIELVLDYGESERSHGADRFYIPFRDLAFIRQDLGINRGALDCLNLNVVVSDDGTVITVAHTFRRRKRHIQNRWSRRGA